MTTGIIIIGIAYGPGEALSVNWPWLWMWLTLNTSQFNSNYLRVSTFYTFEFNNKSSCHQTCLTIPHTAHALLGLKLKGW